MRLLIDQVWGRVGVDQTSPFLHLDIKTPFLKLQIDPPVLRINSSRVELEIDNREFRADLNMYDVVEFAGEYAARARMRVLAEIADIAAQGDRLAAIESGEKDGFANIARENSFDPEVDVELVPAHLPCVEFRVINGYREFREGHVRVKLETGNVQMHLEPGVVRVYLRQVPELHIRAVGSLLDTFG